MELADEPETILKSLVQRMMRNCLGMILLALCGTWLIASVAAAPEAAPNLALTMSVASPIVQLGGVISYKITLQNNGDAAVEAAQLQLDSQSITLHTLYGIQRTNITRFHDSPINLVKPATATIAAHASAEAAIELPAVGVGHYEVFAEYRGAAERMIVSPVCSYNVQPRELQDKLRVRMETNLGVMVLDMRADVNLGTVTNFVQLAQKGFYDNQKVYAVVKDGMLQSGDPDNMGGPGYTIPYEQGMEPHRKGTLSMLHWPIHFDTAGSQFMIVVSDKSGMGLDGFFAVVGQVTEGMEVLDHINMIEVTDRKEGPPYNKPKTDVIISKVTVELK